MFFQLALRPLKRSASEGRRNQNQLKMSSYEALPKKHLLVSTFCKKRQDYPNNITQKQSNYFVLRLNL